MQVAVIVFVFLAVATADVLLALACLRDKSTTGKTLGGCLVCAGVVSVFYLASILADSYVVASLTSSIYFCAIDIMLLFLLQYFYCIADINIESNKKTWLVLNFFYILAVLDCADLMVNVFTDHAISYIYNEGATIAPFSFDQHAPYMAHLVLCYTMIAYGFALLVHKMVTVPRLYRSLYEHVICYVLIVVALNALYLMSYVRNNIDISIITYSILGAGIYISTFITGGNNVLNQARQTIVDHSAQALLIFAYTGQLLYLNNTAHELFSIKKQRNHSLRLRDFVQMLNVGDLLEDTGESARFYWTAPDANHTSYICTYQVYKDERDRLSAMSFVFTNNTLGIDPLTGFQTEQYLSLSDDDELLQDAKGEVGIAVCDLNQLSLINNLLGYSVGDQALTLQASLLREHFPAKSLFVRMHDAKLAVICFGLAQDQISERLILVNEKLGQAVDFAVHLKMDFAICMLSETEDGISGAVSRASSALKTRKLLDKESSHSSAIDALSQMLVECDPETESHVRRTRILGDNLAYNLGLSDYERDQLSLLCLFHDIGKVGIPLQILNKPAALTKDEWVIMREHVQKGYRIARATAGLEIIADPILHHHENWDGSGYPDGLQHESIPILSRIISVIDAYDAMVSDRPYRAGMSVEEAVAELKRCSGTQFDPFVADVFIEMVGQSTSAEEVIEESRKEAESHYMNITSSEVLDTIEAVLPSKTTLVSPVAYSHYTLDADYKILWADENFEELTGYTSYDIERLHLGEKEIIFDDDQDTFWKLQAELAPKGPVIYLEHRIKRKDGTGRYVYCVGIQHWDNGVKTMDVILTDITESSSSMHEANLARNRAMMSLRRLEETVRQDPMTGLLNKAAFRRNVEHELLDHSHICVMLMMDIDNFKQFNDTYGHPRGDELLTVFGTALTEALGKQGYVGRLGGDEFCCLLMFKKDMPFSEISAFTRGVWDKANLALKGFELMPSSSAGAVYATPSADYDTLYRMADDAMYYAKRGGKNQICIAWEA